MIEEIACSEKVTLVFDKKTEAALTNVSFFVESWREVLPWWGIRRAARPLC